MAARPAAPVAPEALVVFDPDAWADRSEPVPAHWRGERDWPDWHFCHAHTRWSAARTAWAREHCRSLDEANRALYPPQLDSGRPDPRLVDP